MGCFPEFLHRKSALHDAIKLSKAMLLDKNLNASLLMQVCGARTLFDQRQCLIYSFGSNGDSSFEEGMLQKSSCEVHTFDPFIELDVKESVRNRPGINFHDYGIAATTSLSDRSLQMKNINDIMSDLRHKWVDILKLDVEGSEWSILSSIYEQQRPGLKATQLLLELHYPSAASEQLIWGVFDNLFHDNFRLFSVEPNVHCGVDCSLAYLEFSFIKVSPDGDICTPNLVTDQGHLTFPSGCLE